MKVAYLLLIYNHPEFQEPTLNDDVVLQYHKLSVPNKMLQLQRSRDLDS
jgi:hypothetical protein